MDRKHFLEDPMTAMKEILSELLRAPENKLGMEAEEPAWDDGGFLVGVARGDDPIFEMFRQYVVDEYLMPETLFDEKFPERHLPAKDLSVVSWVLPQREAVRVENRSCKEIPGERWIRNRIFGEEMNDLLHERFAEKLKMLGIDVAVPRTSPSWKRVMSPVYKDASNWSERHTAYATGLGTFGLSDGLITPVGKAHRVGSVIVGHRIEPTPRPYDRFDAYCLFLTEGKCGACIRRCPAGAISKEGHDKDKCRTFLRGTVTPYAKERFGLEGYGCGLCQTGVPCEARIPGAR